MCLSVVGKLSPDCETFFKYKCSRLSEVNNFFRVFFWHAGSIHTFVILHIFLPNEQKHENNEHTFVILQVFLSNE